MFLWFIQCVSLLYFIAYVCLHTTYNITHTLHTRSNIVSVCTAVFVTVYMHCKTCSCLFTYKEKHCSSMFIYQSVYVCPHTKYNIVCGCMHIKKTTLLMSIYRQIASLFCLFTYKVHNCSYLWHVCSNILITSNHLLIKMLDAACSFIHIIRR